MALLRQLVWTSLAAGIAGGVLLSALQQVWVIPLIEEAERYEVQTVGRGKDAAGAESVRAGSEAEPLDEWHPAPGMQRAAISWIANALAATGFALLLTAGFALRGHTMNPLRGLVWGLAGYAAFVLAPAFGLPPELPGASAAELTARQLWWLITVVATAAGLALVAFAPRRAKGLGVILLLAPHVFGAPQPPPETLHVLPAALSAQYQTAVLVTMGAFWVALGTVCGWVYARV